MTQGQRKPEPFDSAEAAQLQRDIIATVVHDLTSITSALSLRVASGGPLPERDVVAVAALTAQLREVTKPLVWLRGSPGRGALSPSRTIEISTWWQHTLQVVCALLPRGSKVTPESDSVPVSGQLLAAEDLALLSMMLLGACRHVVSVDTTAAVSANIVLPDVAKPNKSLSMEISPLGELSLDSLAIKRTRWGRFCARTATRTGATLQWWNPCENDGALRFSVDLKALPA